MRLRIAIAALGLTLLAGCGGGGGGDGTIPPEDAQALLDQLDGVGSAIEDQDCTKAQTDASQFVGVVFDLPQETGVEVKEQLREAGENLEELVAGECEDTGVTGETGPLEPTTTTDEPVVTPDPVEEEPPAEDESDEGPPEDTPGQGPPPDAGPDDGESGGVGQDKRKKPKHGGKKGSG